MAVQLSANATPQMPPHIMIYYERFCRLHSRIPHPWNHHRHHDAFICSLFTSTRIVKQRKIKREKKENLKFLVYKLFNTLDTD